MRLIRTPQRRLTSWLSAMWLALSPLLSTAARLEVTVLDRRGNPLPQAVVSVEVRGVKPLAAPNTQATMEQRNRAFAPGVLAIQTGTSVIFPNFDTVRHHVYSFSPVRTFEIKLYAGTPAAPLVFDKAGTAVLGCNIHDRMSAFIHVVNTPYFAKSDASGVAELDLPQGEHVLQTWHPMLADTREPVRQGIKLDGNGITRIKVTMAASGG